MNSITTEQADIIGEIANICTGNAATTLSLILNHATNITTPIVKVLESIEDLQHPDNILIKVPYTKGLEGTNLMVLHEKDALIIANLMMGGDGKNITYPNFDDLIISAISEAMNQMCGTIATSMATLLNRPTDIGYPLINSRFKSTFDIPTELCDGSDLIKIKFHLTVGDLIDSDLIQLYPLSIIKQILEAGGHKHG